MLPTEHVALRVVDAAYDLESHPEPWLYGLLESGEDALDQGLGCAAVAVAGRTRSGEPLVSRVVTHRDRSESLALGFAGALRSLRLDRDLSAPGESASVVGTLSSLRSKAPHLHHTVRRRVGCKDVLCVLSFDSDLHGVLLLCPTKRHLSMSVKAETRWRTLASHIGAADRLRRALGRCNQERLIPVTTMPRAHRTDTYSESPAAPPGRSLRDAAARVDSQAAAASTHESARALGVLRSLVDGELSSVDWFVRHDRYFIVARRSDPSLGDPRALTTREKKVVLRTARGESRKLVAYHIGVDRTQVSRLLRSAMRKLGVKNQTELVMKVRCLEHHELLCGQ